jgi:EmrB/QacA subfamily drug resistance transporter
MYAIDATVVAVAFPNFTRELHTTVLWSAWTISIFFIAVTMAMPLAGTLTDSFGRKRLLLISLFLFTGSSLACGFAPSIYVLIAFRFLQGLGGACFLPTASGIVSDHFPESRETAIGLFSSIFSVGAVLGPNLGGWIVSQYSWRYIFYINVPIGVVLMISMMLLLKESVAFSRPKVDLVGVGLITGCLFFLMFGLSLAGENLSVRSVIFAGILIVVSLVLAALFFLQEKKARFPVLDSRVLSSKPFVAANLANLVIGMVLIGVFSFVPLYATSIHHLSTLMSGMILTPRSVAMAMASAATSFLLKKLGYRWPMVFGFTLVAITTMLLAPGVPFWDGVTSQRGTLEVLSILLFLNGVGGGATFPAANNACIELMPEKVGTIVAVRNMFRNVGAALGVSLITLILHMKSDMTDGFTTAFVAFGLVFLFSIPLLFLLPAGRKSAG